MISKTQPTTPIGHILNDGLITESLENFMTYLKWANTT